MKTKVQAVNEIRSEYRFDYSKAVRGKYLKRLIDEGSIVVLLEPDVARAFPDSESVNEALRVVLKAARAAKRRATSLPGVRGKAARS
jgi:hypothetical protein